MGNASSDDQSILNDQRYTLIKSKVDCQIFGVVSIQQDNSTGAYIAIQNNVLQDLEMFQSKEELWGRIKQLQHDSVVRLLEINHKEQNELCSTIYSIQLHFEYLERNLQQELSQRILGNSPFQEGELWYILTCAIAALGYLKSENFLHGDIRPTTILIDNDGRIKIMPKQCFENTLNSYGRKFLHQLNDDVYLSPKLLENLKNKVFSPQHNTTKSDIYSLGLIVLECAMLAQINNFYDFNEFIVNQQIINECLDTVSSNYSNDFVNFLSSMLDPEESTRPDTDDLFDHLKNLSQNSEEHHTGFKIFGSLSKHVHEEIIQQEKPIQVETAQQNLYTPSSQGGTTQSTQDTDFEKIKRSKKCRTDDHDKAKLSKEPQVDGLDPRKIKQYEGHQEKDVNLFYDDSIENKKIKRKKAFNTDDHDKATLTSIPQVSGVDPRNTIKKNIQEQKDQEFEEEPNLQKPIRPKKFSFHEDDVNLKGIVTNITGFDPRLQQDKNLSETLLQKIPTPQVGDNKLIQSQKPNLEKQQQILANQLQFQLKQQQLLASQKIPKQNQNEPVLQPAQLTNNEKYQVIQTKIVRLSPPEEVNPIVGGQVSSLGGSQVPLILGSQQPLGFDYRGVVQQPIVQQPIQVIPQYYQQPIHHAEQIQYTQQIYQQPVHNYVQQPLQGSLRYQ